MPAKQDILIFTKYPTSGFAKTRLIPAVGADRAADISRQLTERIVAVVRSFLLSSPLSSSLVSRIYYTSKDPSSDDLDLIREWLGSPDHAIKDRELLIPQSSGDLGAKLNAAFTDAFRDQAEKVIVVGADIPEINEALLEDAFTKLDAADLVIGPAHDGGYYLLGMKSLCSNLFRNVPWSTERVFDFTMSIAREHSLSVAKLRTLRDVDLPDDLPYFNSLFSESEI